MQDMILNDVPPSEQADADAVRAAADGEVWGARTRALIDAGALVSGNALHPAHTATTLRVRDTGRDIQDGPSAACAPTLGRYQIEAAIASVHAARRHGPTTAPSSRSTAGLSRCIPRQGPRSRWPGPWPRTAMQRARLQHLTAQTRPVRRPTGPGGPCTVKRCGTLATTPARRMPLTARSP